MFVVFDNVFSAAIPCLYNNLDVLNILLKTAFEENAFYMVFLIKNRTHLFSVITRFMRVMTAGDMSYFYQEVL